MTASEPRHGAARRPCRRRLMRPTSATVAQPRDADPELQKLDFHGVGGIVLSCRAASRGPAGSGRGLARRIRHVSPSTLEKAVSSARLYNQGYWAGRCCQILFIID